MMRIEDVESWIAGYERAWRAPGTERLDALFNERAVYRMSPYDEPAVGLEQIAELWEREREGPDEAFEMAAEIVAVDGKTAVVRVAVRYGPPQHLEYRDLWVVRFDPDGRCREFEEWPSWPGQQIVAEGAG
jgi:ketosteroid isomerase-like protein